MTPTVDGTDDDPLVPIECPECNTSSRVPLSRLAESLDDHNESVHDGTEVAQVDPVLADQVADLVATDLGLLDD